MIEFRSADPSVIRSVKQRDLLNAWLRALGKRPELPVIGDYRPERIDDELVDMMGYDVHGEGKQARFLITHEGARLAATYGGENVEPAKRTNYYLDDAIGPERYAHVVGLYRACLARRRPAYSISTLLDADRKEVSYERLLLPFGTAGAVEQVVGSFKSISVEGGFKIANLMGLQPEAAPVILVRAIIDQDFVPRAANRHVSDDIIELS